jgi:hypothetical protein
MFEGALLYTLSNGVATDDGASGVAVPDEWPPRKELHEEE